MQDIFDCCSLDIYVKDSFNTLIYDNHNDSSATEARVIYQIKTSISLTNLTATSDKWIIPQQP